MKIIIKLRSTWWAMPPKVKIAFDDRVESDITVASDTTVEFDVDIRDRTSSRLTLLLYGKDIRQTVVQGTEIIRDQLLHVEDIIIDDIPLGYLIFSAQYRPEYPQHMIDDALKSNQPLPPLLSKITTLGFNGVWSLEFTHPFHIWFLENLP